MLMVDIEELIDQILEEEEDIFGVAIIGKGGQLITQTENWDISDDLGTLVPIIEGENPGSMTVQNLRYMIIEHVPERIIGTNVQKKGHIVIAPLGEKAGLVCYINPATGPREVLFNVQEFAAKFKQAI